MISTHDKSLTEARAHLVRKEYLVRCFDTYRAMRTSGRSATSLASGAGSEPIIHGIPQQLEVLRELFPDLELDPIDSPPSSSAPRGDLYAVPKWELFGATYNNAVGAVMKKLRETRNEMLYQLTPGALAPSFLKRSTQKTNFDLRVRTQESSPVHFMPVQFRIERGRFRCDRARKECALGVFDVALILLTHPHLLQHSDDLRIDCNGDLYSPLGDGRFTAVPSFLYFGGLEFASGDRRSLRASSRVPVAYES
jgi:hypothetical protein